MDKALIQRAIKVALIFMIVFFLLNYFTMKHSDLMNVVGRTLLATLAFFIIYIVAFTILSSDERKMIYGTTLPISLVICLLIGTFFFTKQIGVISGLIIGIVAGIIWELIKRRKMEVICHDNYYWRCDFNIINHQLSA